MSSTLEFLEGFIANPLAVASPIPSGPLVATAIAEQIPLHAKSVLELGPGTGAVTEAILARGVPQDGLVAIESDAHFAGILRGRYRAARIIKGDAFLFSGVLKDEDAEGLFDAIVSGIPVLNRPENVRLCLLRDAMACLAAGGPFIQLSYAAVSPFPECEGVHCERAAHVWKNIPPLNVWVYRKG